MNNESSRCYSFSSQIRKRFSLPSSISKEECFIIYEKELEYHKRTLIRIKECIEELQSKNQLYEFAKYLEILGILYNYNQIYQIRNRPEPENAKLIKKNTFKIYKSILIEYHKWIEQDEHNIKEMKINNIGKRIDDYFNSSEYAQTTRLKDLKRSKRCK